jgi:hypothetical protein
MESCFQVCGHSKVALAYCLEIQALVIGLVAQILAARVLPRATKFCDAPIKKAR